MEVCSKWSWSYDHTNQWQWNFVCSYQCLSSTKFIQMMTGLTFDLCQNAWIMNFSEMIDVYDIKVGPSHVYKLIIRGQGHSLTFVQGRSDFINYKQLLLQSHWAEWNQISYGSPWVKGTKIYWNGWDHVMKMDAMPIFVKNLLKSFLEPNSWWHWNLVCSNKCLSSKFVEKMTYAKCLFLMLLYVNILE